MASTAATRPDGARLATPSRGPVPAGFRVRRIALVAAVLVLLAALISYAKTISEPAAKRENNLFIICSFLLMSFELFRACE